MVHYLPRCINETSDLIIYIKSPPNSFKMYWEWEGDRIQNLFSKLQKQTFLASTCPLPIADSCLFSPLHIIHTYETDEHCYSYVKSEEVFSTLPTVRNSAQARSSHSARRGPLTALQIYHCFPIIWLETGAILILALTQKQINEEISLTGRTTKRGESRTKPILWYFFLPPAYIFKKDPQIYLCKNTSLIFNLLLLCSFREFLYFN